MTCNILEPIYKNRNIKSYEANIKILILNNYHSIIPLAFNQPFSFSVQLSISNPCLRIPNP